MTLNIDGTQQLSFSIPMYYWMNGELKENPNWYNTQNGNLIKGLRKLKVIFNKGEYPIEEASKHVFEFVIMDISESHESDILTCEIKAEGLAFQELGKIGYKLSLSQANFELVYKEWAEKGQWIKHDGTVSSEMPIQNIQFWCEEGCDLAPIPDNGPVSSRIWYYDIQMNWNSFQDAPNRDSKKLYEETYTTSWNSDLIPGAIENYREKARSVEVDHSNLYNITQTIAEKFGVFCRYEYLYDVNYHIIGKKIVFYNNFMNEDPTQVVSFQYPYSSSKVIRTQESAEVTTKLFVQDVDNDSTAGGINSIMFSPANYSHEDYILNFDYMYESGGINKEQYDYITTYNKQMRTLNNELTTLQLQHDTYEFQKPEVEAKKTIAENSIALDSEQVLQNKALRNALDAKDGISDGYIELTGANADYLLVAKRDNGTYYVNLARTNKGIVEETVKIYKHLSSGTLSGQITSFSFNYDEYNNITSINLNNVSEITENGTVITKVYLVYKYDPCLYYDKIVTMWETKLAKDSEALAKNTEELAVIEQKLSVLEQQIEEKIIEKQKAIKAFERMMGPALREGYWQPEDYNDYGDRHIISKTINNSDITADSGTDAIVAWDNEPFEDEETLYYEIGVSQELEYYPCIDLNAVFPSGIPTNLNEYSVVWRATSYTEDYDWSSIKDLTIFHVGSQALIRFIKHNNVVKPVLMLIGAKTMSEDELTRMKSSNGQARLEIYSITIGNNGTISTSHTNIASIGANWIQVAAGTETTVTPIMYPRIKFSSLLLKTDTNDLYIKYNNQLLELGEDYYIRTRNTLRTSDNNYYPEYYVTIKPETIIKYGIGHQVNVDYVLSNANTAIYLDALQVSKENAYPKASYELDTNILNVDLTNRLYNTLAQIVKVNDTQLKLHDAFGYISQAELDLDHCENDKIEIKNYKTKFEDLFSTIVAQTESMKQMGSGIAAAVNGSIPLAEAALTQTIDQWQDTVNEYLDQHFLASNTIQDSLAQLFDEAGTILGNANKAMKQGYALSMQNAAILSKFAEQVTNELAVEVVKSQTRPEQFKVGDIWIQTDAQGNEVGRYVATASSDELTDNSGTNGFVRTYNGTYAQISGAALKIDAQAGTVAITAENNIDIASGNTVNIGANEDVNIVGNKEVNIGGTTINIGAITNSGAVGGINIIATAYNNSNFKDVKQSRVLIHPDEIYMAGSKITMLTGASASGVNAVELDGSKGIWIGSSKSITLSTGNTEGSNTNVEINPTHILFGVNNLSNGNATAVEMSQAQIILGAGNGMTALDQNGINVAGSTSGVQITKDKIGLAVGNSITRSVIVMDQSGIVVGTGTDPQGTGTNSGSYVSIAGSGIVIGSKGSLDINTTNFLLDSDAAITSGSNQTMFRLGTSAAPALEYKNGTLNVTGTITANALYIMESGTPTEATQWINAKVTDEAIWLGVKNYTNTNATSIKLTDSSVEIQSGGNLSVNTANVIVNTNAGNNQSIFKLTNGATSNPINYINIAKNSSGSIFAQLGGWLIGEHRLSSGSSSNYVGLDSGTTSINYAMWAGLENPNDTFTGQTTTIDGTTYNVVGTRGAPFRVTRNGRVYMDKLMLWDSDNNVYKEVDFSDFKQAVALSLSCSGTTISSRASFWGKFNTTVSKNATANIASITTGAASQAWGVGTTDITINTPVGDLEFSGVQVDARAIAQNAHNNVLNALNNFTIYNNGDNTFNTIQSTQGTDRFSITPQSHTIGVILTDGWDSSNLIKAEACASVDDTPVTYDSELTWTVTAGLVTDDSTAGEVAVRASAYINGTEVDYKTDTILIPSATISVDGWGGNWLDDNYITVWVTVNGRRYNHTFDGR